MICAPRDDGRNRNSSNSVLVKRIGEGKRGEGGGTHPHQIVDDSRSRRTRRKQHKWATRAALTTQRVVSAANMPFTPFQLSKPSLCSSHRAMFACHGCITLAAQREAGGERGIHKSISRSPGPFGGNRATARGGRRQSYAPAPGLIQKLRLILNKQRKARRRLIITTCYPCWHQQLTTSIPMILTFPLIIGFLPILSRFHSSSLRHAGASSCLFRFLLGGLHTNSVHFYMWINAESVLHES